MVPRAGLEPAQRERRGILNPLCLPIPPSGLRIWRRVPESNRGGRICNPLHGHSANAPYFKTTAKLIFNKLRDDNLTHNSLFSNRFSALPYRMDGIMD